LDISQPPEQIDRHRRRFSSLTAITMAAAQFGLVGRANAQTDRAGSAGGPAIESETSTSFAHLKQIEAGAPSVGYAEVGPADGPAVILLHGWPYDIHSFVDVAPLLALAGYRVIVPYLRGYGTTRFLSSATVRNGQRRPSSDLPNRPEDNGDLRGGSITSVSPLARRLLGRRIVDFVEMDDPEIEVVAFS
jgi:hypothetical protein